MGNMWDSTDWANLKGKPGAKAGYIDGPRSEWPPEAWQTFGADVTAKITVLANTEALIFDSEHGNAPPAECARAIKERLAAGLPAVLYSNRDMLHENVVALQAVGVRLTPGVQWPAAACYLWAADPTGTPHLDVPWAPVQPVAVQDQWTQECDHSSTLGTFPALTAAEAPPAPPALSTNRKERPMDLIADDDHQYVVFGGHIAEVADETEGGILAAHLGITDVPKCPGTVANMLRIAGGTPTT